MIAPARIAAYDILRRVSTGRADLPSAVASIRESLDDDRDRALATDIATGTLRWRAALDHLIAHAAKRPVARLDPEVVEVLRLSLYQLLHLTRVPVSAVVDDGVQLTKKAGKKSASGFVNAVLRSISRSRGQLTLPPRPATSDDRDAALDYLSTTLSHPRWLVARWLDRVGLERAEAWATFNNRPAPLTLRANRLQTDREALLRTLEALDLEASPATWAPEAVVVSHGNLRAEAERGTFVVQDEASQIVALLAGPAPGPLVLDACASPGGKATAIAATLSGTEMLVACDVRDRRMRLLQRTVALTGASRVRLVQADLTHPLPFRQVFSTVIVDAPCSGLGTLRRDPDIRWRREASSLPLLAAAQRRMLAHAADVVAPGGRLIYATCSSEPEENEEVATAFLASHPAFHAVRANEAHPAIRPELVDRAGHLRTEPDRHGLELFFGAVFERSRQL
ncbi:MAG: 16S rRNA (cytosine(967)-C(5))-methyltransferase RsmB [Vicinamibacterales bacterium]